MDIRAAVDAIGLGVDALGVIVIVAAIAIAGFGFARGLLRAEPFGTSYRQLRQSIGQGILLGLELLVAGDIIRTVVVGPTFTSVGVLAVIVLIRTFLSFSLEVELTGRFPAAADLGNLRDLRPLPIGRYCERSQGSPR